MSKGTGVLVYQVPNRGRANIEGGAYFADFRARGHVIVASGWQADIRPGPGIESLVTPIAKHADGSSITGPVMARVADAEAGSNTQPIIRGRVTGTATPASLDTTKATLTRRLSEEGSRVPLRADEWAFADCTKTAVSRPPGPGEAVPQGWVRSGGALRADLHRQGSAGARHRLRGHARSDRVPSAGRGRQPARRGDSPHDRAGQLAVGQLPAQLSEPGLQPGRGRTPRVRRHEPQHRRAAAGDEHPLRRAQRRGRDVRARQRGRAVVGRLHRRGAGPQGWRSAVAVPGHGDLPEDRRDVRLGRVLLAAAVAESRGHARGSRHPAAGERAPLLLAERPPRRRPGRLQRQTFRSTAAACWRRTRIPRRTATAR